MIHPCPHAPSHRLMASCPCGYQAHGGHADQRTPNPDEEFTSWIEMEPVRQGPSWALIVALPLWALVMLVAAALLLAVWR